jgi:hypothetical protein
VMSQTINDTVEQFRKELGVDLTSFLLDTARHYNNGNLIDTRVRYDLCYNHELAHSVARKAVTTTEELIAQAKVRVVNYYKAHHHG